MQPNKTKESTAILANISHANILMLKGQFTPKSKVHILLFPVVLFINLDSFELSSFGDISRRNFCLLSNIMELNGAHSPKKIFCKSQQQCRFSEIMTSLALEEK